MQWFPRRQPSCVVVGVDKALAMLRGGTGYFDDAGRFVNTFDRMEVWAVHDGTEVAYDGDPLQRHPGDEGARPLPRLRDAGDPDPGRPHPRAAASPPTSTRC